MADRPRRRRSPGVATVSVADTLLERRLALGLTQTDLADLAGVSRRTITALESGKSTSRLDVLLAVAEALGSALVLMPSGTARQVAAHGGGVLLTRPTAPE